MNARPLLAARIAALLLAFMPAMLLHAQNAESPSARWEPDIQAFEAEDRRQPPPQDAVLFVGSSSIRLWETLGQDFPGVPVINRGFGGSEIADVHHFADRIIFPYRPRTIVLYAGDNDLAGGKTPRQVLADYEALVEAIHERLPQARIAFIAIKPSPARWHLADAVRAANEAIWRRTTQDDRLAFIDVFSPMLGDDGEPRPELFVEDKLHLSAAGYALWTERVAPFLR